VVTMPARRAAIMRARRPAITRAKRVERRPARSNQPFLACS
jgi:hypothetical protein